MTANFDNPYDADVVGLWDFRPGQEHDDTGLDDGIAQNGTPVGNPGFDAGWMQADGQCTRFGVHGNDDPFDLTEGTIVTEFKQVAHSGTDSNTIVSRGEADVAHHHGFFEIRVTADGAVEVFHADNHHVSQLSTGPGFLGVNDVVTVSYSWSADKGTQLLVENATLGTSATDSCHVTGLTLDVTENDGESFSIAARESTDGDYGQYFNGCVNYVAVLDKPVIGQGDGIVDGSADNDLIDLAYTDDPQGDMIDAGDALLPGQAPNDDIVDALAGDDVVKAGVGDDTIFAGSGSDTVYGESGDDVIWGDSNAPDGTGETVRESFEWDLAPDPNCPGDIDNGDDLSGGFTQNTGSVDVTYSVIHESHGVDTEFNSINQYVAGIETDGGPADDNSSMMSLLNGKGNTADYKLAFSDAVLDVSFRINDIDGDGVVQVQAFDAAGQPIPVNLSGGPKLTLTDEDTVQGRDTADSNGGYGETDDPDYSVLVCIAGPVASLVISHDQNGYENSGITVTDVFFDVPVPDTGADGDDILHGGGGDDTIYGEAGNDIIIGGSGADTLLGGDDADIIGAGVGDIIQGGEGGTDLDTLIATGLATVEYVGGDPASEAGTVTFYNEDLTIAGTADFSEIEQALVVGTTALDVPGNAPSDTIDGIVDGTSGDDVIDLAYTGDPEGDMIDNGDAVLPLTGEQDVVLAGDGDDIVMGRDDSDVIFGGNGDDTLMGNAGGDAIDGGKGDDVIDGGAGRDILFGGNGDDTISGSVTTAGDRGDLMFGGTGDDTFVGIGLNEIIDGGEDDDGLDIDRFDPSDLQASAEAISPGGSFTITRETGNPENGTISFFDATGSIVGTSEFVNIEMPCFTPGTLIATPKGERRVEELQVGDRVITRDNGIQEIRWMGQRSLTAQELAYAEHLNPVLIRQGALGSGLPERDMMVSPNHRVLVANDKTALYFEDREVLVAAKHLTGLAGVDVVEVPDVTYIHFMCAQHEVVLSDGAWTESFQPGDQSLKGIGNAQRNEIYELFPELKTREGKEAYQSARRSLKRHEARLLM